MKDIIDIKMDILMDLLSIEDRRHIEIINSNTFFYLGDTYIVTTYRYYSFRFKYLETINGYYIYKKE